MLLSLIRNEKVAIGFYILNTFVILLVYGLNDNFNSIIYPLILSIVILCLYLAIKYIKFAKVSSEINNLTIADYTVDYNQDSIDDLYLNTIDDIHDQYKAEIIDMHNRISRNEQLLSQFVHNMKTSVAVIELASSREVVNIEDIRSENEKLKLQLEQSLNVLRLDRAASDYMPKQYSLNELVTEVINDNKSSFIYNQIYPKVISDSEVTVFTDRKWFKYMLEQLVSNAIKYSSVDSNIEFEISNNCLIIRDHGIGIPNQELNRIFELFYTGTNGRDNSQSTGIGLSMVKTVSEILDIEITVDSTVGNGSEFKLRFLTKM
ncbi:sensor histidine kinase [Mollicutes bacterium LVI A0078]|nr:sensor histidine kinase [Mollicutes bacterium LVI A0075]WOO91412.1 sensor histidine kinase [Mollicutes bacterium LVI A0078]